MPNSNPTTKKCPDTMDMFTESQKEQSPLGKVSNDVDHADQKTSNASEILSLCTLLRPQDDAFLTHPIIAKYGSPIRPIYIDKGIVTVNGIQYQQPLIMPLYNANMQLVDCAVLQVNQPITTIPHGLPKGFAYYGELAKDKPIIINYDIEAFFKVASTGIATLLVVTRNLCTKQPCTVPKAFDFEQIQYVIKQLTKAGYNKLYIPVRPEHIKTDAFVDLEQRTAVRLLNQYLKIDGCDTDWIIDLSQHDDVEDIAAFIHEAIDQLPQKRLLPDGHLAKPMPYGNGQFEVRQTGLFHVSTNDDSEKDDFYISQPLQILGEARDDKSSNWQKVTYFHDKDNQPHTVLIPYGDLIGEATEALRILAYQGLNPPTGTKRKNLLLAYLSSYMVDRKLTLVKRTGWYQDAFVLPDKIYGSDDIIFSHDVKNPYSTGGTFEGWQALSKLIEPHRLGVLCYSCAFAGQLISPLGAESGGFHIYGDSTDGKSTLAISSCSVWGKPKDYYNSWKTTDNAAENEAEIRNDGYAVFDELRQAPPKAVDNMLYMLADGQGKKRMTRTSKNQATKHWNLTYLSTGEITIEQHLAKENITPNAGQILRFAHLKSHIGIGQGVWENVHNSKDAAKLADSIKQQASKHYGHAGNVWIDYLVTHKHSITTQAQTLIDQFMQQYAKDCPSQARRIATRFSLVAASGEIATQAGITGWSKGRAIEAIGQCFNSWLSDGFGTGENLEEMKILTHIKLFFETHGNSRFESLVINRHPNGESIRPRIINQVGYFDPDENIYLVSNAMFKKEICTGFNEAQAKKVLRQHGWIECSTGRFAKKVSTNLPDGTRPEMMHFKVEKMILPNDEI